MYTHKQKEFIHRVFREPYERLIEGLSNDENIEFHNLLDELIKALDTIDDLDHFIEPLT